MEKGSKCSAEMIAKQKATKNATFLKELNWEIVKDKIDFQFNDGNVAQRSTKFLTFREFKEFLELGKSKEDLTSDGYSKHLMAFFIFVLKDKLKLNKEQFEKLYITDGLKLKEILKLNNIPVEHGRYLRQYLDISRLGGKYSKRKAEQISLTQRQKELIYGSMMGDAKRQSTRENEGSVGFVHGTNQKDYILWKYNELKSVSKNAVKEKNILVEVILIKN